MKIIEALKKIKDLQRKCEDLAKKIGQHSADLDYETPLYQNQADQLRDWTQSYTDCVREIARLRVAIQRTNVLTGVTITLGNTPVTKCIAEWIHWRRDLAKLSEAVYKQMTDKNLKEGRVIQSTGQVVEVKIRRYYDPAERDRKLELYRSQPSLIDAQLEIVNATTDLLEV